LLLPAVRTNPKRNLPHLALGGCTRASSPIPTRGPFSLWARVIAQCRRRFCFGGRVYLGNR
jgi:hypothetical protein